MQPKYNVIVQMESYGENRDFSSTFTLAIKHDKKVGG